LIESFDLAINESWRIDSPQKPQAPAPIFALEMFGNIAKAMLPQLAEATTGKNSILLENAGNIMQWMVTGTGLFFLGKAVVKSKA